jgi:hypothetical protein
VLQGADHTEPRVIDQGGGPYILNLEKTACHEVGHSVGVWHHDPPYGDCMVNYAVQSGHRQYNYDHWIFINNTF